MPFRSLRPTCRRTRKISVCALVLALTTLVSWAMTGCASSVASANSPLVALVDSTRLAALHKYQKLHPNVRLKVEVLADRGEIPTKVLLYNHAADGGWPDVVFAEPPIVSRTADAVHDFPLDLRPYVPKRILDQFIPGANDQCVIDGRLVCLRNDLAQGVLWYNAKLMQRFGYQVPRTWEEYQALGLRVAREHPGYVVGAFGDEEALHMYFWPSRCPVAQVPRPNTAHINLDDPNCKRVARLFDPLIRAGSVTTLNPLDPLFVKKYGAADKVLMLPAASWFAEYVFATTYNTPKGEWAAAMPPRWSSESQIRTGAHGGSAWMVSRHTAHRKQAVDLAIWLATSNDVQADGPTFPAYAPAADVWGRHLATSKFFAADPYPVMRKAAGLIDPSMASVRYDPESLFDSTVIAAVIHGKPIESAFPKYQDQLSHLAEVYGYTVVR